MKFTYTFCCMVFSLCINAKPSNKMLYGIELFETGQFKEAINIIAPLVGKEKGLANYYLGLIHDPEFNRPPFSNEIISYNKEIEKKAKTYYMKATNLGNAYASFRLGQYHRTMVLRRQNYRHSDKLFRQAKKGLRELAVEGDWLAKYMLAEIAGNSPGTKKIALEAMVSMENEAKKGNVQAQFYLGKALSQWLCRTEQCKNFPAAFAWFTVSAVQGSYHARYYLINLSKVLDEEELHLGVKLADEYLLKYQKVKYKQTINVDPASKTHLE